MSVNPLSLAPPEPDDASCPDEPSAGIDADTRSLADLPVVRVRRGLTLRELEDLLDWLENRPIREKRISADGPRHFQVVWEE